MEVIPTDDGGDDGVIWLRCPECQGFLPKFSGEGVTKPEPVVEADDQDAKTVEPGPVGLDSPTETPATSSPDRSTVAASDSEPDIQTVADDDSVKGKKKDSPDEESEPAEPIAEYAAMLAEADPATAKPYRPTSSFEVGDLIHHLAYGDQGIVVAKESIPGGRHVVKVFFENTGVMRLIEQQAR